MTPRQTNKLRRLTNWLTELAKFNGGLSFRIEPGHSGSYLVSASNNDVSDRKWFHDSFLVIAAIGPRGGCRIYTAIGVTSEQARA